MPTSKKHPFGLLMPPLEELQQEALTVYSASLDTSRIIQEIEQKLAPEAMQQIQRAKYEAMKAGVVQNEVTKLHKNASSSFEGVVKHHFSLQEQAEGKPYQPLLEKFHEYDLTACAQHHEKILEVAFYNQMRILAEPIQLPPEPDVITVVKERPPRNLLERLFGGRE